jgi:hypothetical protein
VLHRTAPQRHGWSTAQRRDGDATAGCCSTQVSTRRDGGTTCSTGWRRDATAGRRRSGGMAMATTLASRWRRRCVGEGEAATTGWRRPGRWPYGTARGWRRAERWWWRFQRPCLNWSVRVEKTGGASGGGDRDAEAAVVPGGGWGGSRDEESDGCRSQVRGRRIVRREERSGRTTRGGGDGSQDDVPSPSHYRSTFIYIHHLKQSTPDRRNHSIKPVS